MAPLPFTLGIDHVNITVPGEAAEASRAFYGTVLGLREIPRPDGSPQHILAWYQLGAVGLHLAVEDLEHLPSKRHICYSVADLAAAEEELRRNGVEIKPDKAPPGGRTRFYIRDPGGNRIEIVQMKTKEHAG